MSEQPTANSPGDGTRAVGPGASERQDVLVVLAALGTLAGLLLVPGVFTLDESNAVAWLVSLRSGRLSLPGTDGLPRSAELLFFDPIASLHAGLPVTSVIPPLYALFALPFSLAGWIGLFLLNLAAWLLTIALVRGAARRAGASPSAAWVGALAFALAGFSLEYAIGVWPHALAACLVLAAFLATLEAATHERIRLALAAGLLAGLATGVRYQHVVVSALLGLILLVARPRRLRLTATFAVGVALPLALSLAANRLRAGISNPISKGPGYVALRGISSPPSRWDALQAFAGQVIDFGLQPHWPYWQEMGGRWTSTGALLVLSAVKKALLQSAPWVLVVLLAAAAAWSPRGSVDAARRALRAVGVVAMGVMLFFAAAGTKRFDGWCHNPRYLLDLMPLLALALALLAQAADLPWRRVLMGALAGVVVAVPPLVLSPISPYRQLAITYAPLALALAGAVLFAARGRWPAAQRWLAPALGVSLGWATAVHLGDDVRAARELRTANLDKLEAVRALLPEVPAALFAHQAAALGPLLLERDVVIAATAVDQGRDAPTLVEAFHRTGRRVFAVLAGMPELEQRALMTGRPFRPLGGPESLFVEIGAAAPAP